jgi:hypothetical protein
MQAPSGVGRLLVDDLQQRAADATGLSDWGDDATFLVGLECLIASVESMPAAPALRPHVAERVQHYLTTRLRLVDDERRDPEIATQPITRPLILTGLPRTGTTWLYELLALDPVVRAPLDWEVQRPWPAPDVATYDTDPRIAEIAEVNREIVAGAPELATMHNWDARLPQECNAITAYHFASSNFWAWWGVPEYTDWLTHSEGHGAFATHRRILQQLQWRGPRGRWTLKSPPHLLMLDDLLAAYPDACLVQTHREPAAVIASLADMVRSRRRDRFGDQPELMDAAEIARSAHDHFGTALERGTRSREDPNIDSHFVDIAYAGLVADPLGSVRRIYDTFGFAYTPEFDRRLRERIATPTASGHGKHLYDPEEFAISALDLPNQFANYRGRFGELITA